MPQLHLEPWLFLHLPTWIIFLGLLLPILISIPLTGNPQRSHPKNT